LDDLIPDHNHLMHLFLVRLPEMGRFWHLHPTQTAPGTFVQDLPSMPAGHYQIFADVVHQSGFPETLLGEIDVPQISGKPLAGDDSEASGVAISEAPKDSSVSQLPDGGRMIWERDVQPPRARVPSRFRFRVEDKDGKPAQDLELYMGMPGHAEFISSDCTVFAHVHPAGSISMAALQLGQAGIKNNSPESGATWHTGHLMGSAPLPAEISFPYGFPRPGRYRIFVQIKRAGRIETGVFDAQVL
jgi:hypothetical protein